MKALPRWNVRLFLLPLFVVLIGIAAARPALADGLPGPDPGDQFVSVGLRAGWQLGSGAFVFGLEASYTTWGDIVLGPVLGIDFSSDAVRLELGYEASILSLGVESGPTFAFGSHGGFGWHGTTFALLIVLPYYQYTFLPNENDQELGLFGKFPVKVGEGE